MSHNTLLSAHPIDEKVRLRVLETCAEIERLHRVKILMACESGSRAWGFSSPDSDYDVRFVYVHALPWYLTVEPQRDVIEVPINTELDVSGWELRKALQLLRRSNPTLLEWFDSPVIYRADADFMREMRRLAVAFFSPLKGRHHYLAMAKKNFRGYLQDETVRLKKYLYVLRPLLAAKWIDAGNGMPPMRFADLAEAMLDDAALIDEINALLVVKMNSGEAQYSPRWPAIHAFIEREFEHAQIERDYKQPQGDVGALDAFLMQTVLQGAA